MTDAHDEPRLSPVVEAGGDGVILLDADGNILMFNPACERLFGYRADEVLGNDIRMLIPPPFAEEHERYLASYRETGQPKVIGVGREIAGLRKDGSTFPMEISIGGATQNGSSIFVGVVHDLTERRQRERALRSSEARLRAVVDTAVDGVILIDARGMVTMFNPACERLFGYRADEVIGNNVKMLMPPPYRDEHDQYLENYRRSRQAQVIGIGREVVGRRKDGSTFPMDLSVGEAKQDGESIFVGMIHDLTERKRTEEQLAQAQKMEAVGQLSGGIAHDFNNLLTVIVGNADMLADRLRARPDLKKLADAICGAGERGAELTQRLLAFSRRQTLMPVEIDCNRLVGSMHSLLRRTLREDIEIVVTAEPELWPAFADAGQLESAILNLALNAQDAMPSGGCLTITTSNVPLDERYHSIHPDVRPGRYIMISLTDDGEGMPPYVLERVFEPFFTTKEVGKGSGLGLSMVYGFIKQSNGNVTIYSDQGLGTTVRLYLPAARSAAVTAEDENVQVETAAPASQGSRETVLVAEDDPFVRAYAVACLEALGYNVVAAVDGRDALVKLNSDAAAVDVLFTDIVMPGAVNGWELADRAQQILPALKVLFTSGYALDTLASRGRLRPGALVLNKPYRKAELGHKLREVIAQPR